jgi:hypothetical protein
LMSFQSHIFLYQSIFSNSDLYNSESVGFPMGGKCAVNTPIPHPPLAMRPLEQKCKIIKDYNIPVTEH